jgi:hypothetical protein
MIMLAENCTVGAEAQRNGVLMRGTIGVVKI